jgi:hypothetical protein
MLGASPGVHAECTIAEEAKQLDPVEVGFCESDAVFIGKVEQKIETMRSYREEGSDRTKHYGIQHSTVKVTGRIKGASADKVAMITELYEKDRAFEFELLKTYLIFAKKLPGDDEYVGASAKCSVQPTLAIEAAAKAIKQLEDHAKGRKKIDCSSIRPKQ